MKYKYQIFARAWWRKENKKLVPNPASRKTIIGYTDNFEEASAQCNKFNDGNRTKREIEMGYKYEFTSDY